MADPVPASTATPVVDAQPTACTGCGLLVVDGVDGCQRLFDDESVREYADVRFAARRRLVVDTYCLQHSERYCASAISLAAHLTGLYIALEQRPREVALNEAVRRWLNHRPQLDKPALPSTHGSQVTIADVLAATDVVDHRAVTERWARGTWAAYADLHPLAREWVRRLER